MKILLQVLLTACLCFTTQLIYAAKQPGTDAEKFSYAVGIQIIQNLKSQNIEVDTESFVQAIEDVLNNQPLKLSVEEMQTAFNNFQQQQAQKEAVLAEENLAAGVKFLEENKKNEGIVVLPNGLQYKVLTKGVGEKPTINDTVTVHYRGTLIDGTEFDSSYGRGEPLAIPLNNVIMGWQEALPLMTVGSKWQIFIPAELGYGSQSAGPDIGPNSTLVFEIELIDISS
jgi:FKBP-type peptidyl-prolyl cis-trans isomerase FklB